jgi:hypothetical protein
MPIVSLVQDPGNTNNFFAGTGDGRIVSLQIRGEKHRVRCSVLHQMHVAAAAEGAGSKATPVGVYLGAVKGYLLAVPAPASVAVMHAYNTSVVSRQRGPELLVYLPLSLKAEARKGLLLDLVSDKTKRLMVAAGDATLSLWMVRLPFFPPSEFGLGFLQYLRHPLLLGAVGMFFMWQMRKGKAGYKDAGAGGEGPSDADMAELLKVV